MSSSTWVCRNIKYTHIDNSTHTYMKNGYSNCSLFNEAYNFEQEKFQHNFH